MVYRIIIALSLIPTCLWSQKGYEITIASDSICYENCPLSFDLPEKLEKGHFIFAEIRNGNKYICPFQLDEASEKTIHFILEGELKPGQKRVFHLSPGKLQYADRMKTKRQGENLCMYFGNRLLLKYQGEIMNAPKGSSELYRRSGFIHPLMSLKGDTLTNIQPSDHIHHYGIWNPWTKTRFQGRSIDFWNLGKGQGTVKHDRIDAYSGGAVYASFSVHLKHMDLSAEPNPVVALNEQWDVKVWKPLDSVYIWDFYSNLQCVGQEDFLIEHYRYAGFGFRATSKWTRDNTEILTSENKTRLDGDATRARWCMINAKLEENQSVVFFSHLSNFQHPEPMRIWPVNANGGRGDVFFQFAPTRHKDWLLTSGNTYRLKYRMIVCNKKIKAKEADSQWKAWIYPPRISIRENQE